MPQRLHNYLKTHRKRCCFSQKQVAHLLSCEHGTAVSRYERRVRIPYLATAFSLQIIYDTPLPDLYGGVFDAVQAAVRERAVLLLNELKEAEQTDVVEHQVKKLEEILEATKTD